MQHSLHLANTALSYGQHPANRCPQTQIQKPSIQTNPVPAHHSTEPQFRGEKQKHSLHLADTALSCKSHPANRHSETQFQKALVHNQNLVLLITAQNPSSGKTDSLHSFHLADSI
jgi:hypothetical protein